MALILDTNALSALAEGDAGLARVLDPEPDLALSAIVLGEYLFGIRQSRFRARYEAWLRSILVVLPMLAVGRETAARYAEIRWELKAAGQPVPSNDLWIAAQAREHGCGVVTRDRHFEAIRGLRVVVW